MPRYTPDNTRGRMVTVHVDGVKVDKCIEVDDDLGFVVVLDKGAPTRQRLIVGEVTVTFPEQS
ncbi:hypothetical protein ACGYJ8_15400 [Sulfitobacter sp. 1A12126]|uniref:hypothetical protein n=1 Tax=Sulfitobacter sp. 1A12126 TaxID=3368591 RepID=UPI003746EC83